MVNFNDRNYSDGSVDGFRQDENSANRAKPSLKPTENGKLGGVAPQPIEGPLGSLEDKKISVGSVAESGAVNRVSKVLFRSAAAQKGMSKEGIDRHLAFIEKNFQKWVEGGENVYIKKGGKEGLERTIEYIPETETVVTHFKRKVKSGGVKGSLLGEGAFSKVKESMVVVSKVYEAGSLVADKVVKDRTEQGRESIIEEGKITRQFDESKHVRRCYRVSGKGLLLEGMSGTLSDRLKNGKEMGTDEKHFIARSLVFGMYEIHEKKLVHHDLHKGNCFVSGDGVWKIGDLGTAQNVGEVNKKSINLFNASPNRIRAQAFHTTSMTDVNNDLWSMGMILYEVEHGEPLPFATDAVMNPFKEAIAKRDKCLREINELPADERNLILRWNGRGEFTVPDGLGVDGKKLKALAVKYHSLKVQIRECYQVYNSKLTEFVKNYQPRSELGELVKKLLVLDQSNLIPQEVVQAVEGLKIKNFDFLQQGTKESVQVEEADQSGQTSSVKKEPPVSEKAPITDQSAFDDALGGYSEVADTSGNTEVNIFAGDPTIEELQSLQDRGCDLAGWRDNNGKSLLHIASEKKWSNETHLFLLELGVDPKAEDNSGNKPENALIMKAVENSNVQVLKLLHDSGCDIAGWKDKVGSNLLHVAVANESSSEMRLFLLELGIDPKAVNESGNAPLQDLMMKAVEQSGLKELQFLKDHEVDIAGWRNEENENLLHIAAKVRGHGEVLQFLLGLEMDPNSTDKSGNTPLHTAAKNGYVRGGFILVNYGADTEVENKNGNTPLDLAEEAGVAYLDENRLIAGKANGEVDSVFVEWFKNQAVMLEFLSETSGVSEAGKEQLKLLAIQAFSKAANIGKGVAKSYDLQITPFFADSGGYHRSTGSKIVQNAEFAFDKDMNRGGVIVKLIHSPLVRENLAREFSDNGEIFTFHNLEEDFHRLVEILTKQEEKTGSTSSFVIDFSAFANSAEEVRKFQQKWNAVARENPVFWKKNILKIAFQKHKGQHVMLLSETNQEKIYHVERILRTSGFVPSPDQSKKAWLQVNDLTSILGLQNLPEASLATKGAKIPKVCENIQELLSRNKQFCSLGNNDQAPPYQRILAQGATRLIEGLIDRGVEHAFEEEGLGDLLQIIYFKINHAMGMAMQEKENLLPFLNQIEQIHQEIQNILAILSIQNPYDEKQFSESAKRKLTSGDSPVIPPDLEPKFSVKPSCMHAVGSVMASVEAEKGTNELGVVVLKDCYYESAGTLEKSKTYEVSCLNGDHFDGTPESLDFDKPPNRKIDLFVCEFHHNISVDRTEYHEEDITNQILAMHERGFLADKCTVMIDTTIDLEQSPSMKKLLSNPEIMQLIKEGNLNLCFVRSAQKFDMLGMDNYYGGVVATVNNGIDYSVFDERMEDPDDQLGGLSYQGMAHLQTHSGDTPDQYRQAIMQNTALFYKNLPSEMKGKIGNPVQISTMNDDRLVFLDIKTEHPHPQFVRYVSLAITELGKKAGLPITVRASFGFAMTNLIGITHSGTRITPGLEKEEDIIAHAKVFQKIQDMMNIGLKESEGLPEEEAQMKVLFAVILCSVDQTEEVTKEDQERAYGAMKEAVADENLSVTDVVSIVEKALISSE